MMHRAINELQARAVLAILVEECKHRVIDPQDGDSFVRRITTADKTIPNICREFRFIGALGFGGKFRNNGNCENTPHVDCYREDETPARCEMIEKANARLTELFGPSTRV